MNFFKLSLVLLCGAQLSSTLSAGEDYIFGSVDTGADIVSGKRSDYVKTRETGKKAIALYDGSNKKAGFRVGLSSGYCAFLQNYFFSFSGRVGSGFWNNLQSFDNVPLRDGKGSFSSQWHLGFFWGVAAALGVRAWGVDFYLKPALIGQTIKHTYTEKKGGQQHLSTSISEHKLAPSIGTGISVPVDVMFVSLEYACTFFRPLSHTYLLGSDGAYNMEVKSKPVVHSVVLGLGINFSELSR